jgi:hypothetical protein
VLDGELAEFEAKVGQLRTLFEQRMSLQRRFLVTLPCESFHITSSCSHSFSRAQHGGNAPRQARSGGSQQNQKNASVHARVCDLRIERQ